VDIKTFDNEETRKQDAEVALQTAEGYRIPLTAEGTLPHYQPDTPHENILQALSEFCGIQWGMKQQVAEEIVEHFKARWRFDWENGGSPIQADMIAAWENTALAVTHKPITAPIDPYHGVGYTDHDIAPGGLPISFDDSLRQEGLPISPISETPATPEEEHHETT
jgi:hypothetical protein